VSVAQGAPQGTYAATAKLVVRGAGGRVVDELAVTVALTVAPPAAEAHLTPTTSPAFTSDEVAVADDTGVYLVPRDPSVGPTDRVWWGDAGPTRLSLLVVGVDGEPATLVIQAQRILDVPEGGSSSCAGGYTLGAANPIELNAGRVKNVCSHKVQIWAEAADNAALVPGQTYQTPLSTPLVLDARRWHDPEADLTIGTLYLHISYSVPASSGAYDTSEMLMAAAELEDEA